MSGFALKVGMIHESATDHVAALVVTLILEPVFNPAVNGGFSVMAG